MGRYTGHADGHKGEFYRIVGANIVALRKESGHTIASLAAAVGVGVGTLGKWEDGSQSIPAYGLHRLEIALECNHYDLVPDEADEAAE